MRNDRAGHVAYNVHRATSNEKQEACSWNSTYSRRIARIIKVAAQFSRALDI